MTRREGWLVAVCVGLAIFAAGMLIVGPRVDTAARPCPGESAWAC